jgi:hypothetical protein
MSDDRMPRGPRRHRSERDRERIAELHGDTDDFVAYFKERVYATFTGLALILVIAAGEHPHPPRALLTLVLGVIGIIAAGFVSDIVSHLAVHRELPNRGEFAILGRIALGGLSTVVVPAILIALAWADVMSMDAALNASAIVYIATLAVIGLVAIRGSKLKWWQQALALVLLLALGLVVIAIQTLAKLVTEH